MAQVFEQIFALADRFSAPLLKMEERMRSAGHVGEAMNRAMRPHEKLFDHVNQDLRVFTRHVREASQSTREFGGRVSEVLAPLAAFGALGSVGGIVEMVHGFTEAAEQMGIGARVAGMAVNQFQAVDYAMKQLTGSSDGIGTALGRLNRNLAAAATGHSKDVLALLDHLHISLRGANGQILSAGQELPKLADAFKATKDPAMQALMATTLFGKAGLAMLPLLDQGSAGIARLTAQFDKYGYALSSQDVEASDRFNESWRNMQAAIGGLTDDISAKLAPVITPVIQSIADWTAKNRDWIATNFAGALRSIGSALSQIDVRGAITRMEDFAGTVGRVVGAVGGLKTVMLATGAVMTASLVAPMLPAITAGMKLVATAGYMTGSVLALGADFIRVIPMIGSFRDAFAALSLVVEANPLGVAVAAAVALGTAGYELYEHWDAASKGVVAAFDAIGGAADRVFKPIMVAISAMESGLDTLGGDLGLNGGSGGAVTLPNGQREMRTRFGMIPLPAPAAGGGGVPGAGGGVQHHEMVVTFENAPAGTNIHVSSPPGSNLKVMPKLGPSRMSQRR